MKSRRHIASRASGFSLVELMVGVAIGLILTLVISQVMTVYEAQTRVTTGTADAQTNGGIALYTISRDLKMAGYSLLPLGGSPLQCTSVAINAAGVTGISPVTITNGVASSGVNASDSIVIRYGTSASAGIPQQITDMSGNQAGVNTSFGCSVNDIAFITNGSSCAITKVTAITTSTVPQKITLENAGGAIANANVACLGTWNSIAYAVSNGQLTRNGTPILAGVVDLQAQYGVSAIANSNTVSQWVDASGTWASPSVADRNRIKAVRVAVIARNARMEPNAVSDACSSTTAVAPTGICAWEGNADSPAPTVDLSKGDTNWARYHYQTFETIIPLRNIIWSWEVL